MSDHGTEAEDIVERICRKIALADFTVRNPKYKKASGKEKEAADFLIPFGDTLLAFQVKSRLGTPEASERHVTRVSARVSAGVDQLKTIKRAISAGHIESLRNAAGIELPFDTEADPCLIGVVVLDLPDERKGELDTHTEVLAGYEVRNAIPTHLFMANEFEALTAEIDTVPDLLRYLDVREGLYSRKKLLPMTSELDLLANYKAQPEVFDKVLADEFDLAVIQPGSWDDYQEEFAEAIAKRDAANGPSYLVDKAIEWMHQSIGFELAEIQGADTSVEAYARICLELSRLTRLERRLVGTKWLEKLKQADETSHGYSAVGVSGGVGVFVLATSDERDKRATALKNLSMAIFCRMKFERVVGVATEALSAGLRSYDAVLIEDKSLYESEELQENATKWFGPKKGVGFHEYGDPE